VFSQYTEVEEVILYGSRAKENFKTASDIDLTMKGRNISQSILNCIAEDLDDLLLPYQIDISIFNRIENKEFLDHIARVGKSIYKKNA
jgi:predicted nucleotidyltransferase